MSNIEPHDFYSIDFQIMLPSALCKLIHMPSLVSEILNASPINPGAAANGEGFCTLLNLYFNDPIFKVDIF